MVGAGTGRYVRARAGRRLWCGCMREWGARGVGQSSWGPAVYGIVEGEDAGRATRGAAARRARSRAAHVYEGPFRSDGARVWRAQLDETLS